MRTKKAKNPTERRRYDRILWLGLLAILLATACGGSADPGPLRTYRIRVGVTGTLLGNGKVLLFGGEDAQGFPRPEAFLLE